MPPQGILLPGRQLLRESKDFGIDGTGDDFPQGLVATAVVDVIIRGGDFLGPFWSVGPTKSGKVRAVRYRDIRNVKVET